MRKVMPKIVLVGVFLCSMILVVIFNFGQTEVTSISAKAEALPSDNCVNCHTSETAITSLATPEHSVSGGG